MALLSMFSCPLCKTETSVKHCVGPSGRKCTWFICTKCTKTAIIFDGSRRSRYYEWDGKGKP